MTNPVNPIRIVPKRSMLNSQVSIYVRCRVDQIRLDIVWAPALAWQLLQHRLRQQHD